MVTTASPGLRGEITGHHWSYEDTTGPGTTAVAVRIWPRNERAVAAARVDGLQFDGGDYETTGAIGPNQVRRAGMGPSTDRRARDGAVYSALSTCAMARPTWAAE